MFAGAAGIVALAALPGLGAALEYRRDLVTAEPWRLLTANWVHVNVAHAAVNAVAWMLLARIFAADLSPARQGLTLLLGGLAVTLGLEFFFPGIAWYRGLSGALHALYFAGATLKLATSLRRRETADVALALTLAVGGIVKVLSERPFAGSTGRSVWLAIETVPQAHLLGACCGLALGLVWLVRDRLSRGRECGAA